MSAAPAPTPAPPHQRHAVGRALRPLLDGVVDYAGLFPPAALAMAPAVRRYAAYRRGAARWLLGRFVVPAPRLEEFEAAALDLLPTDATVDGGDAPWRLSVLLGEDAAADLTRAAAFNARHGVDTGNGRAVADAAEWKADAPGALAAAGTARERHLPNATLFAEPPAGADAAPYAEAARAAGVGIKLRTGGVTADAFPGAEAVLQFLAAAAAAGVPAKATAGLHHALPGEHPLTYEAGAARATMYGFVPVLVAGAMLRAGHFPDMVAPLLGERDPAAFTADDDGIQWRGLSVAGHMRLLAGVGSCSFEEPEAELRALGWLADA